MTFPASPFNWTLSQIEAKVRNVTGTPSQSQLTSNQIWDYINNYYAYTMPFELKEQVNQQPISFSTFANQDVYQMAGGFQTDEPQCYANGFPLIFYMDRDVFYQDWPQQYTQDQVGTGTGAQVIFPGATQASPVIRGTFTITDGTQVVTDSGPQLVQETLAIGNGVLSTFTGFLSDFPITPGTLQITDNVEVFTDNGLGVLKGSATGTGTINYTTGAYTVNFNAAVENTFPIVAQYYLPLGVLSGNGTGTINYVTGAFSVTFNTAPATGVLVYDNYQAYQPARPQGVLFYNSTFTFRPIPDQVYAISLQGFITQAQLLSPGSVPLQTEWGELIAMGASLDILLDRGDIGAYNTYYPIFKRYENVALGRFVQQYENAQSVPRF